LQSVETQQVLGENKQSCFRAGTVDPTTVEAVEAAMAFGVGKPEFYRLASQRIPRLD